MTNEPAIQILYGLDLSEWIRSRIPRMQKKLTGTCIGFGDDQRLLGAVIFTDYTGRSIQCSIATDSPGWCSRRTLQAIFGYVFNTCSCVRTTALVASDNAKSIELVTRLGYRLEGTIRDHFDDGIDMLVFGMLKEECRWL